jgi:predicted amidohydrolase
MPRADAALSLAVLTKEPAGDDPEERRLHLAAAVSSAPLSDLVVLPYLAMHPAFWRHLDRSGGFRHAERPPYPGLLAVEQAACERDLTVLASTYEALGEGVFYAMARVTAPGDQPILTYRQWHALNLPGQHERLFFQPGSGDSPPVFGCAGARIGLLMGGDLWVPEASRLLRLAGAEILLAVTALPAGVADQGSALAAARSIENGVPVVLANRGDAARCFNPDRAPHQIHDDGAWATVVLDVPAIRQRLRQEDPLVMRRPRLYRRLTRCWDASAP